MAKMIKCPTCATQIEVPPAPATGGPQIIKCPGCGKSLKIVVKKPAAPQGHAPSAGGSLAGSVAGGSVSAMTFHGEQASAPDDLPPLDSNCAVCGRPTEPEDLIEDNGKLLCRDCIKGARSKIDRPDIAPDLLDFKRPTAVVRRSKPINVSLSFVAAAFAALVLIACQIYLSQTGAPKGKGRAMASLVPLVNPVAPPVAVTPEPAPTTTEASTGAQPVPASQPAPPENPVAVNPPAPVAPAPPETPPAPEPSIFNPPGPAVPAPAPNTAVAVAPSIPVAPPPVRPNDPLSAGIDKLQNRDYKGAKQFFETARSTYVAGPRLGAQLTPQQQTILMGLAAANIGAGTPQLAKAQFDLVFGNPERGLAAKGEKTRSAVINNAIMVLVTKNPKPREMGEAIRMLHDYLGGTAEKDDFAANVFGTLLDHAMALSTIAAAERTQLEQHVSFLDNFNDRIAQDHPGQLKWGVEWKPRELVERYRASRGKVAASAPPAQLQQEHDLAKAKVFQLQQALEQAKASNGDTVGAQTQYRDALAALKDIEIKIEQVSAPAPKPKWLEKVDPVVPEGMGPS